MPKRLPLAFFARPAPEVARDLLGKILVRQAPGQPPRRARLVETEAYLGPEDAASHARFGPTPRAAIMFGPPGRLYVFLVYGAHHCANVVCGPDGSAGAVLLRAAEPLGGDDPLALRGPGKLCRALAITRADNGLPLTSRSGLFIADDGMRPRIAATARIGVDYAGRWARRRLRFLVPGHPAVSGRRRTSRGS